MEITVTGDKAIDLVHNASPDELFKAWEYSGGYDCDSGQFERPEREVSMSDVWWSLLLYREDWERVSFTYYENSYGGVDWSKNSSLVIDTGNPGESSYVEYLITEA